MTTQAKSKPDGKLRGHPWGDFLAARMRCLVWLRDVQGRSIEEIVETMRMDPGQVQLILMHADDSAEPGAERRVVLEARYFLDQLSWADQDGWFLVPIDRRSCWQEIKEEAGHGPPGWVRRIEHPSLISFVGWDGPALDGSAEPGAGGGDAE